MVKKNTNTHEKVTLNNFLIFLEHNIKNNDLLIKAIQSKIQYLKVQLNKENNEGSKNEGIQVNKEIRKNEKDPRHFAPASKEWKNSVYAFNKNDILDLASRDKLASNSIKNYFNMVPIPLIITKSKRMRDLIRRSSTKQLFVSRAEIKQTSDKAVVTIYTFDRQKRFFYRKLFFLRKWLNENLMAGKSYKLKYNLVGKIKNTKKIIKRSSLFKRHIIYDPDLYISLLLRKKRNVLTRKISRYHVKDDLYIKTTKLLLRKSQEHRNFFLFKFLKSILARLLDKKIYFIPGKEEALEREKYISGKFGSFAIKKTKKYVIRTKEGKIRHIKPKAQLFFKLNKKLSLKSLRSINIILLNYIFYRKKVKKSYLKKYALKLKRFKDNYSKFIIQNHLKKEVLIMKYLTNLYLNKYKFYTYLPGLKSILAKIYNKKIKINLVKLKNIQLNSNIFSEAISIKLRKRTTSLLRILRRSFNFVKKIKPNSRYIRLEKYKNFPAKQVFTYFGKFNVINGNVINRLFNNMYINKDYTSIKGVLRSIKYKWVTGARIEAKGRLTKRYAASRAVFKYKYRGTLRNLERLKSVENHIQSPGVFMLRGDWRPNTQYSLIHSKRRIGAFGIKGWISNS